MYLKLKAKTVWNPIFAEVESQRRKVAIDVLRLAQTVHCEKTLQLTAASRLKIEATATPNAQKDRVTSDSLVLSDVASCLKVKFGASDSILCLTQCVEAALVKSRSAKHHLTLTQAVAVEVQAAPDIIVAKMLGKQVQLSGRNHEKIANFLKLCGFSDIIEGESGKLIATVPLGLLQDNPIEALNPLLEACRIRPTLQALNSLL